jgi:hypothetical protein
MILGDKPLISEVVLSQQMREQIVVPIMGAMSQSDDTIQIHKFLLGTKITEC